MKQRTVWIDVLKGIAILLVVIGHNCPDESFISSFHMPVFFLLSGFLFSPKPIPEYLNKSFRRLLVPYFFFLITIALPEITYYLVKPTIGGGKSLIFNMLYGGELLTCKYAIFWFVTVLWMSTNLFNFILSRKCSILLLPLLIIVGYLSERYVSYPLPWNIQVVPMATAYIWIGYLIKQNSDAIVNNVRHIHKLTPLLLAFMVLVAVYVMREDITLNMKYNHYGIPIVSLLTSTLAAVAIGILAIYTSRFPLPTKLFVLFGEASMVIMYLHQFLKYYLYNHFLGRDLLNICVGLTFSLIIYIIILKIPIGRKFYLGTI